MPESNASGNGELVPRLRKSDAFGKNLLGVTCIAPDFYEDIPLEFLLGEDDLQPIGGGGGAGG